MSPLAQALAAERALARPVMHRFQITRSEDDATPTAERWSVRLDDGHELPLGERLTVGSAPGNDLVLDDPYVSGRHCTLRREGRRVVVVDAGSRNGTFVGGVRVAAGEVMPGMRITVGRTRLRVAAEGAGVATGSGLIGRSRVLRRLREEIARVAPTSASAMVLGESGTGKELVARALHDGSGRRGAFVVVNCGAIAPDLIESELFGHEKGAFTGAAQRRRGVFEEADGGTLFLDEIGELPLALQPRLLRVLEERAVRPVGGNLERKVDVRVVSATHRDLAAAVGEGAFRLDLYHRLATVELALPALRERREDVAPLVHHFLDRLAPEVGGLKVIAPSAMEALERHDWPGNVRELRNALHRAAILGGPVLQAEDLLPHAARGLQACEPSTPWDARRVDQAERQAIATALQREGGNYRAAARSLGLAKSTLWDRARRYGIAEERA